MSPLLCQLSYGPSCDGVLDVFKLYFILSELPCLSQCSTVPFGRPRKAACTIDLQTYIYKHVFYKHPWCYPAKTRQQILYDFRNGLRWGRIRSQFDQSLSRIQWTQGQPGYKRSASNCDGLVDVQCVSYNNGGRIKIAWHDWALSSAG